MKTLYQTLFVFIAVFAFSATSIFAQKTSTLPSVSLKNLDNKTLDIKAVAKEKITVVSFWATWCAPCKKELDNIATVYDEWQEKYNVQLVAVSVDDARTTAKVKTMVNGKGWDYLVLLDSNQELKRALNVTSVPFTFLINQKGEIVYQHTGYKEGDELKLLEKIKSLQ